MNNEELSALIDLILLNEAVEFTVRGVCTITALINKQVSLPWSKVEQYFRVKKVLCWLQVLLDWCSNCLIGVQAATLIGRIVVVLV